MTSPIVFPGPQRIPFGIQFYGQKILVQGEVNRKPRQIDVAIGIRRDIVQLIGIVSFVVVPIGPLLRELTKAEKTRTKQNQAKSVKGFHGCVEISTSNQDLFPKVA
jgi:hypothetical protein